MDTLIESIGQGVWGIEPAAVIAPGLGYVIIGGERRTAALIRRGHPIITLYVIRTWQEFFAWMLLDLASQERAPSVQWGVCEPMNLIDAAYFTAKVKKYLRQTRFDYADQVMSEYIGLHFDKFRDARQLVKWREHEDEAVRRYAEEQIRNVVQGECAANTATGRLTRYVERNTMLPLARQRTILESASSQFAGLADALRQVGTALHPDLTLDEVDLYLTHLKEGRLQAERVIKALKTLKESKA